MARHRNTHKSKSSAGVEPHVPEAKKKCTRCNKFITASNMSRHLKVCGSAKTTVEPKNPCPHCQQPITMSNLSRHIAKCSPGALKRKHDVATVSAPRPKVPRQEPSASTSGFGIDDEITEVDKAFKGRMKTYRVENQHDIKDPKTFLERFRESIARKIAQHIEEHNIKANLVFEAEYTKPTSGVIQKMNFKTKNTVILPTTDIREYVTTAMKKLLAEMDEFYAKGSGWTLHKILHLELRINRYVPLRGSSYMELPKKIVAKHAVVNIMNNDQKCFVWSILAALHPKEWQAQPQRIHHYQPFEHELDAYLDGITFPVSLDNVKLFEKRSGISVNVYSYDKKLVVYPLYITREAKDTHVDLLYIRDQNNSHYCLIKDLSRLVRSQLSKHTTRTWLCKRCLMHYGTEELLIKHKEDCSEHEAVKILTPKEGSTIQFKDFKHAMRVPFVAYADFECMLTPVASSSRDPDARSSYTEKYQKHEAVSFSYYFVYSDGDYKPPTTYFGTDAAQVFVESIMNDAREIFQLYSRAAAVPMELTQDDLHAIANARQCHICGKSFNDPNDYEVRDHDHLTGKFRGMAHNSCNLNFKKPHFLPVFVHNLSGYDTHLFIKMFGLNNETIKVIPNNEERYISYTIEVERGVKLRFLDSLRFMASSLDKLAKNLSPDQFRHTSNFYQGEQLELLVKKGVYPYDYMDSIEKFERCSLPNQEDFYNKLNDAHVKPEDYRHAVNVWNTFNIQNMKDYTLLYNKTDVLLLADIMENFRDVCMQTYQLDPAWYYTAPGLAWSAMLKTTGIKLDLLSDYNMILMIGKGIRGGVSQCSNRYAAANNPYMEAEFNVDQPTSYLTYLDANNLYGWTMSEYMPYKNFKWCKTDIDVTKVPDDAPTGYILEVDLEYPEQLHDLHSDLPLAPERRVPPGSKEEKLLTTLFGKEKYVVHYRNLKQYLSLGMKLKKVHRVISFSQSAWLKPYIDLNTQMRTQARNEFEKDFFKLMNNSVFGKTMENIRNRVDIRLATKDEQVDKWTAQPNFKSRTIFTEQLAAVHMSKTKLMFNKAIYVGMSILDVSKTLMYDFHYNVIKRRYGHKAQLQYTDTDSLTYHIQTTDLYKDIKDMIDLFDTSDYPQPNRYNMPRVNKKVLGKMKDELNGRIMYEHVGLRSKMYSSRSEGGVIKKSKGVKKTTIENHLTFDDYKQCLFTSGIQYGSMNMIRSFKHDLYSVELNKIVLSPHDDKRYIQDDGIGTLPWGHYSIPVEVMAELEIRSALSTQ
ncbi:uncharacterized protein LOC124358355 [Homalodisca vitripennis]|uniref:uncharacterized protein LOC124358355 n=1 Tax=Homalodisca vitripennis TaxID=197043 RepID=UPI001EECA728|nr:uncharacterized protein LOC124358355 [Homalodisca vitripennis]